MDQVPPPWLATPGGTHGIALSGGERQRLALARAFFADPALLILDEPTAHLDPPARRALTADLLHATQDRSVLLITHELTGRSQYLRPFRNVNNSVSLQQAALHSGS